jgi:guanylate kinase
MNKLIIVTAPSGAGKTTIVHHLLQKFEALAFSVSATNRATIFSQLKSFNAW